LDIFLNINIILCIFLILIYKILKYLYTQRRDALKKIIFHSNQKAFAILSSKLLNIESYIKPSSEVKESINDLINENIPYRNELIREIINSINLQGMQQGQGLGMDIEAIFALISDFSVFTIISSLSLSTSITFSNSTIFVLTTLPSATTTTKTFLSFL